MNNKKVKQIIEQYKFHIKDIHKEEIYKWRAVKCFQDNWDIQATDFPKMLNASLALTANLLSSVNYYPLRMLHQYTENEPETVKQLLRELFNEENNLLGRITAFQEGLKSVHGKYYSGGKTYQDPRAVLVYLSLHYPQRYFLYKFTMFKAFVPLVDYPYQPKSGAKENIIQYITLCNILKEEIIKDTELLELHETRLSEREYFGNSTNLLAQDIIYATVANRARFEMSEQQDTAFNRLIKVEKTVSPQEETILLRGSYTNYIDNEKQNKRIGDLGELLVLQHEQEKLISLGIRKQPLHKSKTEGDGLGYDILSYNEHGQEIFIEVKTTAHNLDAPFFITRNELEKSRRDSQSYFLYRLFNFDDTTNSAKYYERCGELTEFCINPILYRVKLT